MVDDFLIRAALAGIGVALIAAPLGCFVVWRRMAYFGSTIAHSGLLGVALGLAFGLDLTIGVLLVAIGLGIVLMLLQRQGLLPTDSLLGLLAHVTLAGGLIVASTIEGQRFDLMAYLFGDILSVSSADVVWIYIAAIGAGLVLIWIWQQLLTMSVHEELAAAEGVKTELMHFVFIMLIAVTVAAAMKIIGILLITALLIIPPAAARAVSRTPEQMALFSIIIAILGVLGGLGLSLFWDTPAGPSIVMILALLYGFSLVPAVRQS